VRLSDADLAQLHDTLIRLHAVPDPAAARLCSQLRERLNDSRDASLDLDPDGARQLQLAVYADKVARKPVSAVLAEARRQAFRYLENRDE